MKLLKKLLGVFLLLIISLTFVDCPPNPDIPDDEVNLDIGTSSGWVKINSNKFNLKYGYIIPYQDGGYDVCLSDADLKDLFKGTGSFDKLVSYISFWYERGSGKYQLLEVNGAYMAEINTQYEEALLYIKEETIAFNWIQKDLDFNPSGSVFEKDVCGEYHSYEGKGLKVETYMGDGDNEYDTGFMNLSFSIKSIPININFARSSGLEIISDPDQINIIRKILHGCASK